jgi:hypothetical protein
MWGGDVTRVALCQEFSIRLLRNACSSQAEACATSLQVAWFCMLEAP